MYEFCTYFDQRYLPRGLALYASLLRNCASFRLRVLCLDAVTHEVLTDMALPSLDPISIDDFERANPDVAAARQERSLLEYYFTCTPALILHALDGVQNGELLTYLDADLWLFADPAPLLDELRDSSIGLVPHFHSPLNLRNSRGRYNIGWITFRNDERARDALTSWRQQCIDWCYAKLEDGKYADQKYLDDWPETRPGTKVLENAGAGLAPWNITGHVIAVVDGRTTIDGDDVFFFHFSQMRRVNAMIYDTMLPAFRARETGAAVEALYKPYVRELDAIYRQLAPLRLDLAPLVVPRRRFAGLPLGAYLQALARGVHRLYRGVFRGGFVYVWRGRVYGG